MYDGWYLSSEVSLFRHVGVCPPVYTYQNSKIPFVQKVKCIGEINSDDDMLSFITIVAVTTRVQKLGIMILLINSIEIFPCYDLSQFVFRTTTQKNIQTLM